MEQWSSTVISTLQTQHDTMQSIYDSLCTNVNTNITPDLVVDDTGTFTSIRDTFVNDGVNALGTNNQSLQNKINNLDLNHPKW